MVLVDLIVKSTYMATRAKLVAGFDEGFVDALEAFVAGQTRKDCLSKMMAILPKARQFAAADLLSASPPRRSPGRGNRVRKLSYASTGPIVNERASWLQQIAGRDGFRGYGKPTVAE